MENLSIKVEVYVGREVDFGKEVSLRDIADGNGPFISKWNISEKPNPTVEQLNAFEDEAAKVAVNNIIRAKRKMAYGSMNDQLDMMFWDKEKGTTTWQEHIRRIKKKYPKVK